jgi:hypothetical protein
VLTLIITYDDSATNLTKKVKNTINEWELAGQRNRDEWLTADRKAH